MAKSMRIKKILPFTILFNYLLFLQMTLNSVEVQNFFVELFRDVVNSRDENNFSRNDVMHLLIQLLRNGFIDDVNSGKENVEANSKNFDSPALQNFLDDP